MSASLLALFFGSTEILIRTRVEPQDLGRRHREFFFAQGIDSPGALFGDSHAARGFTGVAGYANLANPGEVLERTREKIALGHQQRVILQVGPHAFAAYRQRSSVDAYRLSPWWEPRIEEEDHRSNWFRYWAVLLQGGSFTPNMVLQPDGAQTQPESGPAGGAEVARLAASRARDQRPSPAPESTRSAAMLEAILGDLAQRDIDVCLTSFREPGSTSARPCLSGVRARGALLAAIAERHGVRYVDQRMRFDDSSLFFNPDHLTLVGARRFAPLCSKRAFGAGASSLARSQP